MCTGVSNSNIVSWDAIHRDQQWSLDSNSANLLNLSIKTRAPKDIYSVLRHPKQSWKKGYGT